MVQPDWLNEAASPAQRAAGGGEEYRPPLGSPQPDSPDQSAEVTRPPVLEVEPTAPSGYVVTEHQDSFWRISERVYGTGKYYKALYQHNRRAVLRPDQLEAGIQIATPPLDELRSLYPQLCPDGVPADSPRGA